MSAELELLLAKLVEQTGASIKQKICIGDLFVIRVDIEGTIKYGDNCIDRNVYAFDSSGERVWQIEAAPIKQSPKPYVNLTVINDELIAENWIGTELVVDLKNGSVAPHDAGKRAW